MSIGSWEKGKFSGNIGIPANYRMFGLIIWDALRGTPRSPETRDLGGWLSKGEKLDLKSLH